MYEFSAEYRRHGSSSPPLNNQRAITPPGAGRPRHPWLDSPIARRQPRHSHHSWVDTTGGHHARRRHTVSSSRARRRSGADGGRRGDHGRSRGGRYQHNDLSGSGGSPDDWRSSPSNTDEHRDKMVNLTHTCTQSGVKSNSSTTTVIFIAHNFNVTSHSCANAAQTRGQTRGTSTQTRRHCAVNI